MKTTPDFFNKIGQKPSFDLLLKKRFSQYFRNLSPTCSRNIYHWYLDYLERATGVPITRVMADFSRQIAGKRKFIETKWREQGIYEQIVLAALEVLQPTGNPFLDLCIWKGRFPSRMAQFCTMELKRDPMLEQVIMPLMGRGDTLISRQGVRADQSLNPRYLPECDEVGGGCLTTARF